MEDVVLTEQEFMVLAKVVREYAEVKRDDIIGALIRVSDYRAFLTDKEICALAARIEQAGVE